GLICDASTPTYMLTHWVRDRERGPRLTLEHAIARSSKKRRNDSRISSDFISWPVRPAYRQAGSGGFEGIIA
ncbi:MAG: hypothetical protein ACE1ZN_00015, partial [Dehalococcoidia bacterium]